MINYEFKTLKRKKERKKNPDCEQVLEDEERQQKNTTLRKTSVFVAHQSVVQLSMEKQLHDERREARDCGRKEERKKERKKEK